MKQTIARISTIAIGATLSVAALTGCSTNNGYAVHTDDDSSNNSAYYTNDGNSYGRGAESGAKTAPYNHYSFYQKLPGGKRVLCVWADDNSNSGGVSCDWDHPESIAN